MRLQEIKQFLHKGDKEAAYRGENIFLCELHVRQEINIQNIKTVHTIHLKSKQTKNPNWS